MVHDAGQTKHQEEEAKRDDDDDDAALAGSVLELARWLQDAGGEEGGGQPPGSSSSSSSSSSAAAADSGLRRHGQCAGVALPERQLRGNVLASACLPPSAAPLFMSLGGGDDGSPDFFARVVPARLFDDDGDDAADSAGRWVRYQGDDGLCAALGLPAAMSPGTIVQCFGLWTAWPVRYPAVTAPCPIRCP
jgi:hypothetical protein